MFTRLVLIRIAVLLSPMFLKAQDLKTTREHCGTMQRLALKFARNPQAKAAFEQDNRAFTNGLKASQLRQSSSDSDSKVALIIPVVFHIVTTNPASVTDATILAQLELLNKVFSATNADTSRIPAYFKPFVGRSSIQFCLAQRTPSGEGSSGIERIKTTQTSFSPESDAVKKASTGGANSWDKRRYFNIWVCQLVNNVIGYATFPNEPGNGTNDGVVIDYRTLPGGSLSNYNSGKTLAHETGHFFDLYHIWGDDRGECTGTDYIDDTPNQADATKGCTTGIKTDACTPGGNGVMYQNYMDYSFDSCLVMYTNEQVERMQSALITYRSSLITSDACTPPVLKNYDARLSSIDQPSQRLCSNVIAPVVTIQNNGSQTLTSLDIVTMIDSGSTSIFKWTGSLPYLASTSVTLNTINLPVGSHTLFIYVSKPNGNFDETPANDTLFTNVVFYSPVTSVEEGFEENLFPPFGWDIVNPDNHITWKKANGISKTGKASVVMENFNYSMVGSPDDLRLPTVNLQNVDSAFFSFQVAAATYTASSTTNNNWDTLQVLVSTDCGKTYTSVYKKFGSELVTRPGSTTNSFVPNSFEWRKDSVNLASFIGKGEILISIRNITGYENNVYLDDINVRTVVINPNLKRLGFLVTPNPTYGSILVQFFPQPNNLLGLQVFNMAGQKLSEINVASGQANNRYRIDISKYSTGSYIVRAIFTDRIIIRKILKL